MTSPISGPFFTKVEAGRYCRREKSDAAAAKWIDRRLHEIRHVKAGQILISKKDIDDYLLRHVVEPRKNAIPADTPGDQVLNILMGPCSRRASETQAAARKSKRGAASDVTPDHTRGRR